jgi:hypothetical protein
LEADIAFGRVNGILFFTEILHLVQNFREKEKRGTTLLQAKLMFRFVTMPE